MSNAETAQEYLTNSGIQDSLQEFLKTLFASREVPFNPYPAMVNHFRQLEQTEVLHVPPCYPTIAQSIDYNGIKLHSTKSGKFFAQKHIAERIDEGTLCTVLDALEQTRLCPFFKQSKVDDLTATSFVAAVGLNIFSGLFVLTTMSALDLEQHICIEGDKLEKVISVFTSMIIKELYEQSATVYNAKIQVTTPSYKLSEPPSVVVWTLEMIQASKSAFISNIKAGVIAKSSICLQFLLQSSLESHSSYPIYYTVNKHFILHHITTSQSSVCSFCDNPWLSIEQGIFFHADAVNFFIKCLKPTQDTQNAYYNTRMVQTYESHDFIQCFDLALHYTLIEPKSTLPLSDIMTLSCNGDVVRFRNAAAVIDAIHKLTQLQSNEYIKVYPHLQLLIKSLISTVEGLCLQLTSSYMPPLRSFLLFYLQDIGIIPDPTSPANTRAKENTNFSRYLRDTLKRLFQCVADNIARDIAYHLSSGSSTMIYQLNELRANLQPSAQPSAKSFFSKKKAAELPVITNQIQISFPPASKYVVDIAQETNEANAIGKYPRLITTPVVQLQYLVDTRMDTAFTTVLTEILNDRTLHPSKIYPTFVSKLRAFGAQYVVFNAKGCEVEAKKQIKTAIYSDNEMLSIDIMESEKPRGFYGTRLALSFAEGNFEVLASWHKKLSNFLGITAISPSSLFAIQTGCSYYVEKFLQSPTIVMPFTEHIMIESLQRNTFRQCVELFSNIVLQNLLQLFSLPEYIMIALQTGSTNYQERILTELSPNEIRSHKETCRYTIEHAVKARNFIRVVAILGNIRLHKYYVLHVKEASQRIESFVPMSMHISSTHVFFSKDDAKRVIYEDSCITYKNYLDEARKQSYPDLFDQIELLCRLRLLQPSLADTLDSELNRVLGSSILYLLDYENAATTLLMRSRQTESRSKDIESMIQSWLTSIHQTLQQPHFHDNLARFAALEKKYTKAQDMATTIDCIEDIRALLLFIRLGWQYDVYSTCESLKKMSS